MAEKRPARKGAKKSAKATAIGETSKLFTDEERAAMRELVQERKAASAGKAGGESDVLAKIAAMAGPDRVIGERLYALIKTNAPELSPRLWYGMPACANKNGNVVCFFQDAQKFKSRYATLGFSDKAKLDEGNMWPTAFAVKELGVAEEARIGALVKKAAGG
jgi:uncharacterized protein YdhG (YjbR/CyaY superfamily)